MTIKKLLLSRKFQKFAMLEYGYTPEQLAQLPDEELNRLQAIWQDAPATFYGLAGERK